MNRRHFMTVMASAPVMLLLAPAVYAGGDQVNRPPYGNPGTPKPPPAPRPNPSAPGK